MKVREVMKSPVITIKENESIEKALRTMNIEGINGMPVVSDDDALVGMVVKADIYRFLIEPGHYESCPVEWVMTNDVICVNSGDEVVEAAKLLRDNDIIAMPVMDKDELIGIISVEDIIEYFIEKEALDF